MPQYDGLVAKERLQRAYLWLKILNNASQSGLAFDIANRVEHAYRFEDIPVASEQLLGLLNESGDITAFLQGIVETLLGFERYEQRR